MKEDLIQFLIPLIISYIVVGGVIWLFAKRYYETKYRIARTTYKTFTKKTFEDKKPILLDGSTLIDNILTITVGDFKYYIACSSREMIDMMKIIAKWIKQLGE